jgi:hypothetical protein
MVYGLCTPNRAIHQRQRLTKGTVMADRQAPSTQAPGDELPLVYPIPPVEMTVRTVIYRSQPDLQLEADVYCPATLQPGQYGLTVIMIHGGPVPKNADPKGWRIFRDYAALLAGLGVITVVFNHRLHGPAEYFTAHGDVVALLEHVRANADDYHVDRDRLVLWAFAGGGPLLTAALDPPQQQICGLIAYYCSLEFPAPAKSGAQTVSREILERLSPVAQLRRHGSRAAMLLARAGRDAPAVNRGQAHFMDVALSCDVPIELLNHPTGEHAFDVRNDDARSREIIGRTLEFIRGRQ